MRPPRAARQWARGPHPARLSLWAAEAAATAAVLSAAPAAAWAEAVAWAEAIAVVVVVEVKVAKVVEVSIGCVRPWLK